MTDNLSVASPDEGLHAVSMFLAKSGLSLLPGGGILAELLTLVVANPATKRRDAFLMDLSRRIEDLEKQGRIDLTELARDETVSAIILQAAQIAQRSVGEAKIEALKLAAVKGAIHESSERYLSLIVLGVLDRLTEAHVKLLKTIAELARREASIAKQDILSVGVTYQNSLDGLLAPQRTVTGEYYDGRIPYINGLILSDLATIGVIESYLDITDLHGVDDWSTDPSRNGVDRLRVTEVGRIVLDEIGVH